MIESLLVANRGEIAVRILRTCRRLGIRTVAVYSEADRHGPHVGLADAGVLIGPAESNRSYLDAAAIIAAAKRLGVAAIHPGYGFLSESEALIACCEDAGIVFVGPNREAIRRMGSKIEAKGIAETVGVATVPGYHGADQSAQRLLREAERIGYPVLIKASAGGGGKGMRHVEDRAEFTAALAQAKQEALAGFGSDEVLLEKLIAEPRHIEVQLAADQHGNIVHLFERECSIQRNHQKVIEEAPAAYFSDEQRRELYCAAITLGKAIGYDSLGTVEFLLDNRTGKIYFLEMNTRLQVEHPVTEYITGLDLVEWQIRIASGEVLPLTQEQIHRRGWAIEARINAEDPAAGFRPETGTIDLYREPAGDSVRVDSGVRSGSVVTPYYDQMLAKVIAHGNDREAARVRLRDAIKDFALTGLGTNLAYLQAILSHRHFSAKPLTTGFLPENLGQWQAPVGDDSVHIAAAVAHIMPVDARDPTRHVSPWQSLGAFRLLARAGLPGASRVILEDDRGDVAIVTLSGASGSYRVSIDNSERAVIARWLDARRLQIEIDGHSFMAEVDASAQRLTIGVNGLRHRYRLLDEQQLALRTQHPSGSGGNQVTATLPGQVVEVRTQVGATVASGDILVVLDSMKLLHSLSAGIAGRVRELFCAVGDSVTQGAILVDIEPDPPT